MGCEVVTVSTDKKFSHLAWRTVEGQLADVNFQMAADPTAALSKQFGIYLEGAGVALRGTYLISPEGVLMNSEVNFLNVGRNVDEMMRKFKANLYVAKKSGEAVPAQWKEEGDTTLTPSAKMVGKVQEALANGGKI
jgi:alkyl hydroperoxide reductase subunit AhpC